MINKAIIFYVKSTEGNRESYKYNESKAIVWKIYLKVKVSENTLKYMQINVDEITSSVHIW